MKNCFNFDKLQQFLTGFLFLAFMAAGIVITPAIAVTPQYKYPVMNDKLVRTTYSKKSADKVLSVVNAVRKEDRYNSIIVMVSRRYGIDPALVKAIIMSESRCNPNAVSRTGARGLMQLMPRTAKSLGVVDSFNPEHNINGGVKYFSRLLDRFEGDVSLALAAYNAGSRNVRKYRGVPPFKETRRYIKKVMKYHQKFSEDVLLALADRNTV